MARLSITARGQVTLRKEVLQHLGVKPGDQLDVDKLPGGELRVRVARPPIGIKDVFGILATSDGKSLTIEEMSRIAEAGWAGRK